MTVFSIAVQPILQERYLIVTVAPLALLVAWAFPERGNYGAPIAVLVSLGLVVALGREMRRFNALAAITDWRIRNAIVAVDRIVARGGPFPILFARRFEQYPLIQLRPDLASSIALIDFDGNPPELMRRTVFERDMARRITRFYPQYRLFNPAAQPASSLFLITSSNEEDEARRLLKNFQVITEAPDLYYVEVPNAHSSGSNRRFNSASRTE